MLQAWLVVAPSSRFYTFSIVLFHKYTGENVAVTNCMSHFLMFVPTKSDVKLSNGNMEPAQEIGIIYFNLRTVTLYTQWYQFIIVQVTLPIPSHWVTSNFILVFKRLHLNILNIVILYTLKLVPVDHPSRLKKNIILSSNQNYQNQPLQKQIYFGSNCLCYLKSNISHFIYQLFDHVLITRLRWMARKVLMKGIPTKITDF